MLVLSVSAPGLSHHEASVWVTVTISSEVCFTAVGLFTVKINLL